MTSAAGPGELLADRYRLDEPVAAGGAGQVWRAMDLVLERVVAVKLLRPDAADDPLATARFLEEARSASRLSHPSIAQVHDFGNGGPAAAPFLVMELVEGPSLADLLATGPLGPSRTVDVIAQVAAGLHAAHSAGIVHRDIKPANLLIDREWRVKITDFGIASLLGSASPTSTVAVIGTPGYLAPERAAGVPATAASDLYSLGVVAYECLTGTRPFNGPAEEVTAAHLRQPFPPLPASVPVDVGLLVASLTAGDPSRRPPSASAVAALADALRPGLDDGVAVSAKPGTAVIAGGHAATRAVTVTDIGAHTAWGELAFGARLKPLLQRKPWRTSVVLLAVTAALATAGLIGWHAGVRGAESATTVSRGAAASPSAPRVSVSSAALVGLPASQVLSDLRQLGLRPFLVQVATSAEAPGTVLSVQPGGNLPLGTVVVVTAAEPLPQQGRSGDGGGSGTGGDGGGDGGH